MKNYLILSFALLMFAPIFAQKDAKIETKKNPIFKIIKDKQPEQAKNIKIRKLDEDSKVDAAIPIGFTNYDLQSNAAVANRFIRHSDGTMSAVWTQDHSDTPGGASRGSGYNYFDGSSWQYTAFSGNDRIEAERTGWPTLMSNGTEEFVASHQMSTAGLFGYKQSKGAAGSSWTASPISGGPEAMLWPRAASAGDYYYVIAVDDYQTSQAEIDGVHFYKSENAGQSWTYGGMLEDYQTYYGGAAGDTYAIDAYENYVAVVVFGDYADTRLWKSDDYGETWTQTRINDFPVDGYDFQGGQVVDIDDDALADTVLTTDNTGDVLIDNNGKVHVVFSRMRQLDEDASDDGAFSWFPYTDYLLYWNEDMGEGTFNGVTSTSLVDMGVPAAVDTIGWSFDQDDNNTIWEFVEVDAGQFAFGTYYTSLTSFSTLGIDENNNIYCVFSTVMETEDYLKTDASPNAQQYRGVYVRKLDAATQQWGNPLDISSIDGASAENVFPTIARHVDDNIHLWLQWDGEPGLHIRGDGDAVTDNYILYKGVSVNELIDSEEQLAANAVTFKVYPNPATDFISIGNVENSEVVIYNMLGAEVERIQSDDFTQRVNTAEYAPGTYLIKVSNENGVNTQKVIIQ